MHSQSDEKQPASPATKGATQTTNKKKGMKMSQSALERVLAQQLHTSSQAMSQLVSQQLGFLRQLPRAKTNLSDIAKSKENIAGLPASPSPLPKVAKIDDAEIDVAEIDDKSKRVEATNPISPQPLLEAQKQLWVLSQITEAGSMAYSIYAVLQLNGPLRIAAMRQAVQQVVDRHEALRTVIIGETQQVNPPSPVETLVIDFSKTEDRDTGINTWINKENQTPFDLSKGPLFRAHILKLTGNKHWLVVTAHHIVADGLSINIILQELALFYSAACQGKDCGLKPPLQFRDYVKWQEQQSQTSEMADHEAYWLEQFDGAISNLDLPTDHTPPSIKSYQGNRQTVQLDAGLCRELQKLSQKQGCTRFMTLLAAFMVLLHRLTGQDDIIVGIPVMGRSLDGGDKLVGYCTHLLPIRSRVSWQQSFSSYLKVIRGVLLNAYQHQDYPFAHLINKLNLRRDGSQSPLVSITFNLDQPEKTPNLFELETEWVPRQPINFAAFDIGLNLTETGEDLVLDWDYNTDLFDVGTAERFLGHFQTLLANIVADPEQSVSELPLLTGQERHQLLVEWNNTRTDYPEDKCIHQLFEAAVTGSPDAVAAVFEKLQLTYKELNSRSNQLAHYLQTLGVGPEILVGICIERSLEMVIGILGILKAGGAYLPLDPTYPKARLQFILEDAGAPLLLTTEKLANQLPKGQRVCLDSDWEAISRCSNENPVCKAKPENLAYVIYTSGSTGKPKGALIIHKGVVNYLSWCTKAYQVAEEGTGAPVHSSIGFDATLTSIFAPLVVGKHILLFPEQQEIMNLNAAFQAQHEWSFVKLTPAHLELLNVLLLGYKTQGKTKRFIVGGEALLGKNLSYWRDRAPDTLIVNEYGPTETVVGCCVYEVSVKDCPHNAVPIGHPIANTQIYLLDNFFQPVPIGVPGELYIGGAGVARGYLNRPELTRERFIPDPFSNEPGATLYKTGDLARYLPDGNIEYLGRLDNQIKIRGFRIEPGEIEAELALHPDVRENVVIVQEEQSNDDKRLVAYLTPNQEQTPDTAELRRFLKAKLPDYMIPQTFVWLKSIPLTTNGKIDRHALLRQESTTRSAPKAIFPQTEAEQRIAAIWKKLLHLEQVDIYDNFFELGGHSLLMARMQGELQTVFERSVPLVELFQYPTISSLAKYLAPSPTASAEVSGKSHQKREFEGISKDIAIVGMSGRFPGARDTETFWENIRDGIESIQFFSDEELLKEGIDPDLLKNPKYVKANGFLENIDLFDAKFFGFSPREAEIMDPQQRIFLECAVEAIENAGYDLDQISETTGIYAGMGENIYEFKNIFTRQDIVETFGYYHLLLMNGRDFFTARTSYKLNLKGPSVGIQTACSTSLVAVHIACQSIRNGECQMALAGGITINALKREGYLYVEDMIFSNDGHCRAFDANAQGTVDGNGAGIVVLKKLEDALADGDNIYAVIKGSAINNDGSMKVGFSAPSVEAQSQVIAMAQAQAGVNVENITYVETHGTGTILGDPIEIAALTKAFRAKTDKNNFCAVGSIKTNIGHLDIAAGVAGLIKTVLALKHQLLPPSLHYERPNPNIDFDTSPFFVNAQLRYWQNGDSPRCAGITSLGMGGANAHMIVEEAPPKETSHPGRAWQLLVLSAKTETALGNAIGNLAKHLKENPELNPADVAYTLQAGRKAYKHKCMLVCSDMKDGVDILETLNPKRMTTSVSEVHKRPIVFMFPGLGNHYVNMAKGLYQSEPVFREHIDFCSEKLQPLLGRDLRNLLYPEKGIEATTEEQSTDLSNSTNELDQAIFMQPAVFVVEYALAKLWMAWGYQPQAMIGYSIGEYAAACLAEVISLEDALRLVVTRAQLIQAMPGGGMLAIKLPENEIVPLLSRDLSLAIISAHDKCVVSGHETAIESLERQLHDKDIGCRRLHVSHAFHSPMMEACREPLIEFMSGINLNPPKIPYISNLTGTSITKEQAVDPNYWADHTCKTVRFAQGIDTLLQTPDWVFLEVGPGQSLRSYVLEHPVIKQAQNEVVLSSLRSRNAARAQADEAFLLKSLGQLWLAGYQIDWSPYYANERRCRLPLPTYPFERRSYWLYPPKDATDTVLIAPRTKSDMVEQTQDDTKKDIAPAAHARANLPTSYVAPRNEIEQKLADIWQKFFGIDRIGIHDDFFELGGHSLLATQVLSRVRETFSIELTLHSLFESPTIAEFSKHIKVVPFDNQNKLAPPLKRFDRPSALPLSFAQERMWLLNQLTPDNPFYSIPEALQLEGLLNEAALKQSFYEIIQRHETLRTTFSKKDGKPVQVIHPFSEKKFQLKVIDLSGLQAEEQEAEILRLIDIETQRPFDLSTGPLLRVMLIKKAAKSHVLFVNMHHILSDGWSSGVLIREFSKHYEAFSQEQPSPLPPLPIQYADFTLWQRQWLTGEVLQTQQDYWQQKLADAPQVLDIPTDRPRPPIHTFRGGKEHLKMTPELTLKLNKLSQQTGSSLFMTTLTAFALLMNRYSGMEDIVIGAPIANRTHKEVEPLIGFFVNTLALRIDLSGNPTFIELLARVRQVTLDSYAHQDLPFEQLVETLQPKRDMTRNPLVQVSLTFQNAPISLLEIPDLTINPIEFDAQTVRMDLEFHVWEEGGGMEFCMYYYKDLFEEATIKRLLGHFHTLLASIA
ncbi:MAG: amino acid adenylation domain-containing protein, partial [Planctomycetes bacterium]|nr:amino acid adenylation domain-containing protein [Planctomycetota bacterium]